MCDGCDVGVIGVQFEKLLPKLKAVSSVSVMIHEPAVLIEGVLFRARYLGSTQLACDGRPSKMTRMMQAQEAVGRIKVSFGVSWRLRNTKGGWSLLQAPDGEHQPFTDVDLFISTEKIMVLNADLQVSISRWELDTSHDVLRLFQDSIMMDHPLRTIR